MPVDDEVLFRAQRSDRRAMEAVLESYYVAVHRMAYALSGREDVGRGIIRFLMTQAPRRLEQWRDGEAAERWFYHHTVLTARRAAPHQPTPQQDVLVGNDGPPDPAYLAFVRALRTLPMQQREAFILHHGEHFSLRQLAIAMDCSTRAAEVHLQSAQAALQPIAGEAFAAMKERLARTYAKLTPAEDLVRPSIRGYVQRSLWPRRIKRLITLLITLALLAAGAWAAMRYRDFLPWR